MERGVLLTLMYRGELYSLGNVFFLVVTTEACWATALVIVYLQTHEAERSEEWELMVEKAHGWLQSEAWGKANALIECAKVVLAEALPA